jgi:hypothetical protein
VSQGRISFLTRESFTKTLKKQSRRYGPVARLVVKRVEKKAKVMVKERVVEKRGKMEIKVVVV